METTIRGRHSDLGQIEPVAWRSGLRSIIRLVVLIGLLATLPDCLCFGSADGVEHRSTANVEVPFRLFNDNLVIVKATVGTLKNVNMILDTGTNPSAISQELADRLTLKGKTERLQTLNGAIQAQSLILPYIQVGPLEARPIRVLVQDLSSMERSLGISLGGIVGLDILCTGSFTIDYRMKKIVFGLMIEGHEVRLLVDSGTWGLLLYRNRLNATQQQVHFDSNASISSPGGFTHIGWFRVGVSLGKDNLGVRNVGIADIDSDPQNDFDGLLGFAKMGFLKVSFDFENGLFGWE
jgi:hypothetical protein